MSLQLYGTEIQCQTSIGSIDIAIKYSSQTERYYLLIFQNDQVSPVLLKKELVNDHESNFNYHDTQLNIDIDLENGLGSILLEKEPVLSLYDCQSYE